MRPFTSQAGRLPPAAAGLMAAGLPRVEDCTDLGTAVRLVRLGWIHLLLRSLMAVLVVGLEAAPGLDAVTGAAAPRGRGLRARAEGCWLRAPAAHSPGLQVDLEPVGVAFPALRQVRDGEVGLGPGLLGVEPGLQVDGALALPLAAGEGTGQQKPGETAIRSRGEINSGDVSYFETGGRCGAGARRTCREWSGELSIQPHYPV